MTIDFDEEKHEYRVNGKKVPSVSEILAPLSGHKYSALNPSVLAAAAARGTAVHEACEALDYGMDPEISPEIAGYIKAYKEFLRDYFPKWEMIEQIVTAYKVYPEQMPPEDCVMYCGTVDRYGLIDGTPSVVDIKTYASMDTDALLTASCQTQLYARAIQGPYAKRYVVHLKKDGTYRLIDLGKFDKECGFNSSANADMLVQHWWQMEEARRARKKK